MENPYQPPAAAGQQEPGAVAGLRRLRPLAGWSIGLYGVSVAAETGALMQRFFAPDPADPPLAAVADRGAAADERFGTLGYEVEEFEVPAPPLAPLDLVMIAAAILAGVLYLIWKYRAAANARLLDAVAMPMRPALAVGGYFIPIAFFVLPYRAMAGISRATFGHCAGVGLWWGCHVGLMLGGIAVALLPVADEAESWLSLRPTLADYGYHLASVVTFLISAWLVARISRAQDERGESRQK